MIDLQTLCVALQPAAAQDTLIVGFRSSYRILSTDAGLL